MQVYWDLGEWSAGTLEDLPSLNAHSGHPLQPHSQALHSFPDRKKLHIHCTHTLWGEIGPQMKSTGLGTRSHHLETVYTLGKKIWLVNEPHS